MTDNIEELTLTAPDISCDHCVATIQKAIGGIAGVGGVEADVAAKQVTVRYDSSRVSREEIETAMGDVGYPVTA